MVRKISRKQARSLSPMVSGDGLRDEND